MCLGLSDLHNNVEGTGSLAIEAIPEPTPLLLKARKVPLWWDAGTLAFLQNFMARRIQEEASGYSLVT